MGLVMSELHPDQGMLSCLAASALCWLLWSLFQMEQLLRTYEEGGTHRDWRLSCPRATALQVKWGPWRVQLAAVAAGQAQQLHVPGHAVTAP